MDVGIAERPCLRDQVRENRQLDCVADGHVVYSGTTEHLTSIDQLVELSDTWCTAVEEILIHLVESPCYDFDICGRVVGESVLGVDCGSTMRSLASLRISV